MITHTHTVGNIAYDSSKEKLKQIFSEVGPIVNFRMVYDRDTGKPKGYAFCEYKDEASAMSAMRNLNDRDLSGRKLRVDFADNNKINMPGDDFDDDIMGMTGGSASSISGSGGGGGGMSGSGGSGGGGGPIGAMPPMMGQNVNTGGANPSGGMMRMASQQQSDSIMGILQKIPKSQLYDVVSQMKHIVMTNPEKARQIFAQNPTLAIVMLDIQYILGMVKQPFTQQQQQPPQQAQGPLVPPQNVPFVPSSGNMGAMPPRNMVPPPHGMVPPSGGMVGHPMGMPPNVSPPMGMPPRMATSPPPSVYSGYPPVASNQPMPGAQQRLQDVLQDVKPEDLQQLLAITPQQLEGLPEDTRQQVLFIQSAFRK